MENPIEKLYKFCPNCKNSLVKKSIDKKYRLICENCGFIFWNNPRPCVSAIIAKNNQILLLKRACPPLKDYWCLPGGVIDYDEKPEISIVREIKEEINLDIKIEKLIGAYLIDNDPRGNGLDLIYSTTIYNGSFRLSIEHSAFEFFSFNNLPSPIAYKHREAIIDYQKIKLK